MFSYIVLGHYPVTNSNGMHLKWNFDFNCYKNIIFKILWSIKEGFTALVGYYIRPNRIEYSKYIGSNFRFIG